MGTRRWTPRSLFDACGAIEGFDGLDHDRDDIITAYQYLIDSGALWSLQGTYGRTAARLIQAGVCTDAPVIKKEE